MKPYSCAVLAMVLLAAGLATGGAAEIVIEGTVQIPPAKSKSAATGKEARYGIKSGSIAPAEGARAIVYLDGDGVFAAAGEPPAVEVKQKGYQFVPSLLPIRKGTRVMFPNHDDDYHHVFSYSKQVKEFDLGRYRKNEKAGEVVFDKTGYVEINCEIHDHMELRILVLDTPYFTTTDEAGKYTLTLKELAAGKHTLKAWVSSKANTLREQPVDLQPGTTVKVDFPAK